MSVRSNKDDEDDNNNSSSSSAALAIRVDFLDTKTRTEEKNASRVRVHEDIERAREKSGVVFLFSFPSSCHCLLKGRVEVLLVLFRIFFFCFHIESLFVRARIGHGLKYEKEQDEKIFFTNCSTQHTRTRLDTSWFLFRRNTLTTVWLLQFLTILRSIELQVRRRRRRKQIA